MTAGPLQTVGTTPVTTTLSLSPGRTYLIEVQERDNDAVVEVLDANGQIVASADHPELRTGTRRTVIAAPQTGPLLLRIAGREYAEAVGSATVRAFDLTTGVSPACRAAFDALSAADASYAVGRGITSGRVPAAGRSAHDAFVHAAESYAAVLRAFSDADDRHLRGEAQLALAALDLLDLPDWPKAEEWAKAAEATLAPVDPVRHARAESVLAYTWIQIGQSESVRQGARLLGEARALLERVSDFHRRRGAHHDLAMQTTYISLTYFYQGRYAECVTYATAAGRQFDALHDTVQSGTAWQNRALCLWGLGHLSEARDDFVHLLDVFDPQTSLATYLAILANAGLLDLSLGKYDESLRLYDRGLALAESTQRESDQARCLHGVGVNYRLLGDLGRARDFLERALVIRTSEQDGRSRMDTLRQLALVDARQGRVAEAVDHDQEALKLAVDPLAVESIRVQLASHFAGAGRPEEGKSLLDEILESGPRGDPIILAQALVQRAVILRGMGRTGEALSDLGRALQRFHALGNVNGEFAANLELARTLRLMSRTSEALAAVERALNQGDAVRLQSVNPDFRTQLEAPLRDAYDLKIELLRAQYEAANAAGNPTRAAALAATAFAAADSSRAHTLSDVAAQQYSAALRHELAADLRRRETIYRQLAERRAALDSLTDISPVTSPRARHLLTDIAELKRQADTVNTAIAARAARPGELKTGRRVGIPSIPAGTALVSFWLGAESSYAWVVSAGETHWVRLAAPALIGTRASAYRDSLARLVDRPKAQRLADAEEVSELVVRPLESWLSGATRWIIVPDGALDYVPFAALPASGASEAYAVLHHDVALTPAVWMLESAEANRRPPAHGGLLLVADPVYQADDPRLAALPKPASLQSAAASRSEGSRGYRRLPYTAQEAAAIRREFPSTEVEQLIGPEATRDRFLAEDLSRYRFVHIATHGMVDTQVPELSALVLGSYDASGRTVDGAVRVPDLALLTLHAEVAVFSGCDTALGREVASEGLTGITSTVLARGARAVVSSLWPVSDEMSARLMTEFYRHLLRDSTDAPAALAAAMRGVLSRQPETDPALWAAYQVSVVSTQIH